MRGRAPARPTPVGYEVDADELASTVSSLARCHSGLLDLSRDLELLVSGLHAQWQGLARDAHSASHAIWCDDFARMTQALADLREVARTARVNYDTAAEANLAMWEQLR